MSDTRGVTVSQEAAEPVGPYPHARRVGGLLFLSGIGPRVRGERAIPGVVLDASGEVVDYDIAAQCHAVMRNVRAVLEASGSSWEKLVDVTVFLTDIRRDFATYNRVYAEYFPDRRARAARPSRCAGSRRRSRSS